MSCLEIDPKRDLLLSEFVGKFSLRYDPECDYYSDYLVSGGKTYLTVNEAKPNSYVRSLAIAPVCAGKQGDELSKTLSYDEIERFGKVYSEMFIIRSYLDFCRRGCPVTECPVTAAKESQVYENPIIGLCGGMSKHRYEERTFIETHEFTKNFDLVLRTGFFEDQPSEIWFSQRTA